MSSCTDPYKVLMVRHDATIEEIRSAFKNLIREWHPDVADSADAHDRSAAIIQAYHALLRLDRWQPERRSSLDRRRHDRAVTAAPARERRRGERRGARRLPRPLRVTLVAWSVVTGLTIATAVAAELPYWGMDEIELGGPTDLLLVLRLLIG